MRAACSIDLHRGIRLLSVILAFLALSVLSVSISSAEGTAAGTIFNNKADGVYTYNSIQNTVESNTTYDKVAELIDVDVEWQDTTNIRVSAGDTGSVATFRVTNLGNGNEKFALVVNATIGVGDDFDPSLNSIYLDTNDNGIYEPASDDEYDPGNNEPLMSPGDFLTVFVLCDIPPALANGATGIIELTATSTTGSGDPGTAFAGAGDNGSDAVVGLTGGTDTDSAVYEVSDQDVEVSIVKSQVVDDGNGGDRAMSGSTIVYTLTVTTTGTGTALGAVVTDTIPKNTTYIDDSLTLNGSGLTDDKDGDAGDVGGTTENTVTVELGDLTSGSPVQVITFEVSID